MEPADLLGQHSIEPGDLEVAPALPAPREMLARIQEVPPRPCAVCGDPVATARVVRFPDAGSRWVDLCWDHGMAVRPRSRVPETLEGILADLRAAAREAGLPGGSSLSFYSSFEAAARGRRNDEEIPMTASVPPTNEPDAWARTCPGDQIGPCAACGRPTHKYGSGARSPLCEYCDIKAVERWGGTARRQSATSTGNGGRPPA